MSCNHRHQHRAAALNLICVLVCACACVCPHAHARTVSSGRNHRHQHRAAALNLIYTHDMTYETVQRSAIIHTLGNLGPKLLILVRLLQKVHKLHDLLLRSQRDQIR